MKQEINFGIGFITGRPNICNIINKYYNFIIEQTKELKQKVNFTFFILYDLNYLDTREEEFYNILPEVYEKVKIKYLTPQNVIDKRREIIENYNLSENEVELLIGSGYAKARNTILYEAVKEGIDYLMYWDDDEYPLAAIRNENSIKWVKQKNVLQHIKNIENADITYGYRCGMINPLPFVKYNDELTEEIYKEFIEAIKNEAISWEKFQCMYKSDSGIGFADSKIADYSMENEEMKGIGKEEWVLGSGICLNLKNLNKIPAFYNPPGARGEDTFFSCALATKKAKVLRIPVYHFHDAFLKFTFLMDNKFPKNLRKIISEDTGIEYRFLRTAIGWTKYKPLLYYIIENENYNEIIQKSKSALIETAAKVSTAFDDIDLTILIDILCEYDNKVKEHYDEYIETNNIWEKLKLKISKEKEYAKIN